MSDTPRTDARDNEWVKQGRYQQREREMLDFARQLEREIAALRIEERGAKLAATDAIKLCHTMEQMLAELRAALEEIATHSPHVHNGRSRSFTNWQDSFGAIQHIAIRALKGKP